MTRFFTLLFALLTTFTTAFAQPANDDCATAVPLTYAADEASAIPVQGDTRGGTASTVPTSVCSGSFYTDDIWYSFTTPATLPELGTQIRAYFDKSTTATDVTAVGMAIYSSCGAGEVPIVCFSSDIPGENKLIALSECLLPNHQYSIRIWSTGNTPATEGTFLIAVFANDPEDNILWRETFGDGLSGWTTEGTCADADSNANAGWTYRPTGLIDQGAWIFAGAAIESPTVCDGAVGVDSDYMDTYGIEGNAGNGPCTAPSQHILISPEINTSNWNVAGLSMTWTQGLRQYLSTYFVSYRTKDGDEEWSEWVDFQVNTEFVLNSDFFTNDVQRLFLSGAAGHDFVQIRFVYNANYYMWIIDDVALFETECTNTRVQTNFFAIPPFAQIPDNQLSPFFALADIYNAGACEQDNVTLRHTVTDISSGEVIYNETNTYGSVGPDSLAENKLFNELINLPVESTTYQGEYVLTQDSTDFDPTDNTITFTYTVGGDYFAHEDGFTRSIAVAEGVYDEGAPLSYGYGNVFAPTADVEVEWVEWGVNNPADMVGKTVNVYLLEWTDSNGDRIAQNGERDFLGFAEYTFDGTEPANVILTSFLENFNEPGEDIIMQGGTLYFAMVEYVATSAADPQFFILASDARNYNATTLASDTAYAKGLVSRPTYMTVLQHSPDGIIANIDFEVRELSGTDTRIHFSDDVVPLIRLKTMILNTDTDLPSGTLISVFPNPATNLVNVNIEFTKPYADVRLRLIDNSGRTVYTKTLKHAITNHVEPIRVDELIAGHYMLQIETVDGQRTIPVVVK
jgi:hypothetical protein